MEEIAETTPGDGTVRLLLVDDDRTCRRIFRAMLPKDIPALAVECDDGNAALAALEIPPYPDIIVCDIMMPNLDGFEFIKKVRDMPRVCQTPIIMVTSNAFRENVSRAAQLNVCRFLKKPLTRADVESAVRFAMTQNERKRSSIIEAQQRLCLDDRAYFELACGFSRAVTESITFVRSAISRDRWQMASIRVNALHGSIQLVGDDRLAAVLGRVSVELTHWDVNRVTIELEALEQENERFARTLIQLFTDNSGASPQAKPDAGESLPAGEAAVPVPELA
jgi:CheY-like chemotaxis protein